MTEERNPSLPTVKSSKKDENQPSFRGFGHQKSGRSCKFSGDLEKISRLLSSEGVLVRLVLKTPTSGPCPLESFDGLVKITSDYICEKKRKKKN